MTFLNPGFWLGLIVALAAAFFAGKWQEHFKNKERVAAAEARVATIEKQFEDTSRALAKDRKDEVGRINTRHARALAELRDRPDRRPEASGASCQGATGRELSRPDAEFLEGYSARAERIRAALKECYAREDELWRLFAK